MHSKSSKMEKIRREGGVGVQVGGEVVKSRVSSYRIILTFTM